MKNLYQNLSGWQKGILVTICAQVIWGFSTPIVKIGLYSIPPFSFLFLRCLLTSLILFTLFETRVFKAPKVIPWPDKRRIFLAGFCGVFLNIALYFVGQRLTTVSGAGIIFSTGTIFVVAYSFFFLKERLSNLVYLGIITAFVGSLIIIGTPLISQNGNLAGNILIFAAVGAGVASYLTVKPLISNYSAIYLTYCFFLVSLPFAAVPFVIEFFANPGWIANTPLSAWAIVGYIVIGSSIIAYSLNSLGLRYLAPSLGSVLGYISSILAVLSSIIILGERPSQLFIIGAAVIVVGLILSETRHRKARVKHESSQTPNLE